VPRPRRWLALLGLLALTGCTLPGREAAVPSVPPPPTVAAPRAAATAVPAATEIVLPTRTLPPPSATPTPTASPSPTASYTPSPTATPTATPTPCDEVAGRLVSGTFPSAIQGGEQRYQIYLPPCYGATGRLYPVLYLFHGQADPWSHWDYLGVHEAADEGIVVRTLPPFLIVLPFAGEIADNTSGGDLSFEGVVLNELIPFIEDRYCAWPAREGRVLGGISRGGYWSLEIAFRHPELFRAVGGHSAALFPDNDGPAYNPLTTGLDPRVSDLAIYLDIGDQDWLRQGVFDLHAGMNAAGIEHVWQLNPGVHSDAYWREHLTEYLAWYASHWPQNEDAYPPAGRPCRP
jgi:enterochelin esterase-like enzyme